MAASDGQISERLRAVIASKQLDRRIENAGDRHAIESFYAGRNYAPLWIRDGELTARAKDAIVRLKAAADEGLDAADYPVPDFGGSADATADADIKLTHSVLAFARQMEIGRIAPTRVAVEIDYGNHTPEPGDVLRKIAGGGDINATLDSFDPPHEGFRTLKRKLAELRANSANASADDQRIADGAPIKPGAKDPRVPQLRSRLKTSAPGDSRMVVREHGRQVVKLVKADELVYDKTLYNAVRNVQANADIKPTGVIDSKTIAAINGPKPEPAGRHRARQHGALALAAARSRRDLRDGQRARLHAQGRQRPPRGVAHQDRRRQAADADAAHQRVDGHRDRQPVLVRAAVDHPERVAAAICQRPENLRPHGAGSAQRSRRQHQRGAAARRRQCARPHQVQFPEQVPGLSARHAGKEPVQGRAARLQPRLHAGGRPDHVRPGHAASGDGRPDAEFAQLYSLFGQDEKIFKLQRQPKVHLTYQTAFVDDEGKLQLRDDIYGMDARIHAILHSDERKIADVPPPQDPKRDLATAKSNQEILQRVERREALNPFKFFEQLFR